MRPMPRIKEFLDKNAKRSITMSDFQLQKTSSNFCGYFSAVALVYFSQGKSLKEFLSNFSYNRYLNDLIIENMFNNNAINKFQV